MALPKECFVLFSTVQDGKAIHKWPVGVFTALATAKAHVVLLKTAHRAGDVAAMRQLDPASKFVSDDSVGPSPDYSAVRTSYNPQPPDSGDDVLVLEG